MFIIASVNTPILTDLLAVADLLDASDVIVLPLMRERLCELRSSRGASRSEV
jgi:hypothetical protein